MEFFKDPEVKAWGKAGLKALKELDETYTVSNEGEGMELGGSLVMAPGGQVAFLHRESKWGHVASPQDILQACEQASEQSSL